MELLANIFLALGAMGAGAYCLILSRRIRRLNNLEDGMGGAIAVLSVQVDDLTKALETARYSAAESEAALRKTSERAEAASAKLEILIAGHENGDAARQHRRTVRVQRSRQIISTGAERHD